MSYYRISIEIVLKTLINLSKYTINKDMKKKILTIAIAAFALCAIPASARNNNNNCGNCPKAPCTEQTCSPAQNCGPDQACRAPPGTPPRFLPGYTAYSRPADRPPGPRAAACISATRLGRTRKPTRRQPPPRLGRSSSAPPGTSGRSPLLSRRRQEHPHPRAVCRIS